MLTGRPEPLVGGAGVGGGVFGLWCYSDRMRLRSANPLMLGLTRSELVNLITRDVNSRGGAACGWRNLLPSRLVPTGLSAELSPMKADELPRSILVTSKSGTLVNSLAIAGQGP